VISGGAWNGASIILLAVGLIGVVVAYAVIFAASRRDRREVGWTLVAALGLLILLAFSMGRLI
jgi:heme A synthase